jgi:hypothetical protein
MAKKVAYEKLDQRVHKLGGISPNIMSGQRRRWIMITCLVPAYIPN